MYKECFNCFHVEKSSLENPCIGCVTKRQKPNWEPKKPTVTKAEIIRRLEAIETRLSMLESTIDAEPEIAKLMKSDWCNICMHGDTPGFSFPCSECSVTQPTKWEKNDE